MEYREEDMLEDFVARNKEKMRQVKDSEFTEMKVEISPIASLMNEIVVKHLSKDFEIDTIDAQNLALEYGIAKMQNCIKKKGLPYMKHMMKKFEDAGKKGNVRRQMIISRQMSSGC